MNIYYIYIFIYLYIYIFIYLYIYVENSINELEQENQIKEQHKNRIKKMNEFLNIAKQRLQEKQSQEEELKMSQLTLIIDHDKTLTKTISKLSQEKQSNKNNDNKLSATTTENSVQPETSIQTKSATKPLPTTSSMRKFKSTKPRISKADKKFYEGIYL